MSMMNRTVMSKNAALGLGSPVSAGHVLQMIREGNMNSRADIARATGLARSTVSQRVDALIAAGLVNEESDATSTGGRPPQRLIFNARLGVVLAADFGATHSRIAVTDLAGNVLAEEPAEVAIDEGPERILGWAVAHFAMLLKEVGCKKSDVRGIGVGVPGPVEFATGRAVSPPIMPGWHNYRIPVFFGSGFPGVPVLVDNDVNVMAVGEYWAHWRKTVNDLILIKVATGIGAGIIVNGHVLRGAQGAAGDLGHVRLNSASDVMCTCGNKGCIEAIASGPAIAKRLEADGIKAEGARDVVTLVRSGSREASAYVRDAGRDLGLVISQVVNLMNPAVIVIGGDLAYAEDQLFAGVREAVYRQSGTLATSSLQIVKSRLGDRSGVTGAAITVIDRVLSAEAVDQLLAGSDQAGAIA